MGVKLRATVNPLEASIKDGMLNIYYFNDIIKKVKLPIPSGISIERQCNFFKTPMESLICYLNNDKYVVLIRFDGTVDVLTNKFVLLKRARMDVKEILDDKMKITFCGSLSIKGSVAPAYLAKSTFKDAVFIYSDKSPITLLIDLNDITNQTIYAWAMSHNDVGTMHIMDNSSNGSVLWVNFGTKEHISMNSFQVLSSKGVIGGIVI